MARYFGAREEADLVREVKVGFLDIESMGWRENRS